MKLCRCIDCSKCDMRKAENLAKLGFGVCPHSGLGEHVSVLIVRKCANFERAEVDVVEKRERFLRGNG